MFRITVSNTGEIYYVRAYQIILSTRKIKEYVEKAKAEAKQYCNGLNLKVQIP